MITNTTLFDKVRDTIDDAILVAWDGCHKIYLAMDNEQADWFRENYSPEDEDDTSEVVERTPEEMLATLGEWWEKSCGLRFISAVTTNHDNPNAGYVDLISQFEDEEDYTDDDE